MVTDTPRPGYLLLEDGSRFDGLLYGPAPALGEAVFNSSHTGYQEILSDPSYHRQIMTFTAAHIGNTGVNDQDLESGGLRAAGAVVRSLAPRPSSWRARGSLETWMSSEGRPLLAEADTRAITLHLRERGAQRAGLFEDGISANEALEQVRQSPSMAGANLAAEVSCERAWVFNEELPAAWYSLSKGGEGKRIAVLDYGVKRNILRELARRGCEVTVLPAATSAEQVLAGGYDGVLLSNGPGDPDAVESGIAAAKGLIGELPLFGICLGHQILAIAAGLETYKLPFGHRASNHPVRELASGNVEITSQNHGFAVALGDRTPGEPDGNGWAVSHLNLNDNTVEGLSNRDARLFTIQYHPEASPGPHEGSIYFDRFVAMLN